MYFKKDNLKIYYEKYGNGKDTILILPGWGNTRATFYHIINYFLDKYSIYIIDYPSFGRSDFLDKDMTIYDYTNIIKDFMEYERIFNPIIIAHSFGGRISILLDGYYEEKIKKLVLIDSAGIKPKKNLYKIIKGLLYKLLKKFKYFLPKRKRNIYLRKLLNLFASSDYKSLDKSMYNTFKNIVNEDLKNYIKFIKSDTLILWGKKDKETPIKDAYYMKKNIKKSKLVIFNEAGHFSYLNYINETNRLIEEFIKDVP